MSRAVYFDCFSGASGDMLLGAIVDCGVSVEALADELASLSLGGYRLTSRQVSRAGFAATKVDVELDAAAQPHRGLTAILAIIEASSLPAADKSRSATVFTNLGRAEAKVHGEPVEAVGFHEVGAVDAIVDIVGTVVGLRLLGVDAVYVSPLPVGAGFARAAHGTIPVPGPATLELLTSAGAPIAPARANEQFELLTPTGAALLTTLGRFERPALRLERVGYGAGGRDTPNRPNVVRAWLGEVNIDPAGRTMLLVETNIDDMNPELYGWVLEQLFAAGAVDAWCTPIQMKKNRPAVMLQALCPVEAEAVVAAVLLRETTTLGVRVREVRRHTAPRSILRFDSSLGPVQVKLKELPGEPPRIAPEYEACRALAEQNGLPLIEVYRIVAAEAAAHIATSRPGVPSALEPSG